MDWIGLNWIELRKGIEKRSRSNELRQWIVKESRKQPDKPTSASIFAICFNEFKFFKNAFLMNLKTNSKISEANVNL